MSEDQVNEEVVQEDVQQEAQEQQEQQAEESKDSNALYSSLFDIVEEEEQENDSFTPLKAEDVVSLTDAVDKLDKPAEEVQEEVKEQEPAKEETQEPEGKEVEKSEPKKKKVKQVIDPDVPEELRPQTNALAEEPVKDTDQEFTDSLLPEEREVYDLAKYASEKMPEYKGADQQFKKYFTDTRQYIEKRLKEDPHLNLADDEEYKTFIARSRPKFTSADARKVEQEMLLEKAEARAREKLKPEIERVRREQERINLAPKVQQKKAQAVEVVKQIIPEDMRKVLEEEGGVEKLAQTKPMEYAAIDAVTGRALASANLLVDITTGNVSYDPNNADHVALLDWVNQEQENFINTGQTHRDGKVFMRRERYFQLPENKRAEYYTWSDDDLLQVIAIRSQEAINVSIQKQQEMLKAYIGQQQPQAQQPKPQQPRQKAPSMPAGARPSPETPAKTEQKNALFATLGI